MDGQEKGGLISRGENGDHIAVQILKSDCEQESVLKSDCEQESAAENGKCQICTAASCMHRGLQRRAEDLSPHVEEEGNFNDEENEKVCRVCHLGLGASTEALQLGCHCKDDLGIAHKKCAEAWFKLKGNRICEICGSTVQNIVAPNVGSNCQVLTIRSAEPDPAASSWWRRQPLCNFLLAFVIVAFLLPWVFHVNFFS